MAKKNKLINQDRPDLIKRILAYLSPFKGLVVTVIILNTMFSVFSFLSIALVKPIFGTLFPTENLKEIEQVTNSGGGAFSWLSDKQEGFYQAVSDYVINDSSPESTLISLSVLLVSMFVIKNIFKYLGGVSKVRLSESVAKSIRDSVFKKIISLPIAFFSKNKSGQLMSVVTNDVNVMNASTVIVAVDTLREVMLVVLFLVLLLSISPYLTVMAFSTSIVSLLLLRLAIRFIQRYASRMQQAMADYTTAMQETISGIRVVKAYNAQENAGDSFTKQTWRYIRSAVKFKKIVLLIPSVNEVFAIVALCVVLYIGGTQVLVTHEMKSEDLMTFLFTLFSIMAPISKVFNLISKFEQGLVAAGRVFKVSDEVNNLPSGEKITESFESNIEFKEVDFA
ncbi:MAG: ABC transporter transmembrane domain-containing protein [Candidatus Kapabacteria bacterium]|jgi:subfamily B ATP-binding cassette protein MsbA|nr:ABC transporter transmembrane domain-containing protein [Candidatus Kapabacteria bacterium]